MKVFLADLAPFRGPQPRRVHFCRTTRRYKDTVWCGALGAEVLGHCQEQLMQTLTVRLLKPNLFSLSQIGPPFRLPLVGAVSNAAEV